jgi:hypothetical protein
VPYSFQLIAAAYSITSTTIEETRPPGPRVNNATERAMHR